ncbi:hypothetical protein ACFYV7_23285 [Nocardia suismassiliense]|uniref:DUF1444 family protein n=1 Tax=Nocardia suismassiliense TaxID=2077092 RepID=A0ABW6QXY1_9NOCA
MNVVDPTESVVVFMVGPDPDDGFLAMVHTQDDHAVQRAWQELVAEHNIRAEQVTAVVAEWQPSAADAGFIEQTFGEVDLSYLFDRPAADGWDAAFAAARVALQAEIERRDADPAAMALIEESTKDGVVLPVLRSRSLPGSDIVRDAMEYLPLGDHVYATLARMAKTPRGTIAQTPLLNHEFADHDDVVTQFSNAAIALADGLSLEGWDTEDGPIARVFRQDSFQGSSAILLPRFHSWVAEATGWQELVVAVRCPDELLVTPADSPMAERLRRDISNAEPECAELRPTLFRVTGDGLENIEFLLESSAASPSAMG